MNSKIRKALKYIKGAGISYAFYGIKYHLDSEIDFSLRKYGKKKFAYKKIKKIVKKYKYPEKHKELSINNKNKKHLEQFPIWICWFQGIEEAPDIVKACINSVKDNIPNSCKIHIITLSNLDEYIEIPKKIKNKLYTGKMTYTQYSDIIRYALLSKYGGFWIDSTVLVTSDISHLCNYEYYTKKSDRIELNFGNYLIQGRFTVHLCKGDNNNILYNFLYDAYVEYFNKMDISIDYFLTSLFVDIAYEHIHKCRKMMDDLEINDRGMEARLCEELNNLFIQEKYDLYCSNMPFQKLSYKMKEYREKIGNKETFYGYIIRKYLKNKKL